MNSGESAIRNSPSAILVIKPSSLGDIVHTLPAVVCVLRAWPDACMRWVVNPEWAPVLEGLDGVETVIFPRSEFRGLGLRKALPWARSLRALETDLALDFQGLLRSGLIASASRARRVAGLSDAREGARFFYDQVAQVTPEQHAVERYLTLVGSLGIDVSSPPEFPLPPGNPPAGFPRAEPFVLLHPFSRGAGKSLTAQDVRLFCKELPHLAIVLAGRGGGDFLVPDNVIDLRHKTSLAELIWLARHAGFVVSVDSGPMHIAAAVTDRLLSIHTWSDPRRVGPYNRAAWVLKDGVIRRAGSDDLPAADMRAVAAFVGDRM